MMIVLLYFDWAGSRKELKDWKDKIIQSCDETGVEYRGMYGSMNEKWNYVAIFGAKSYDEFMTMSRKVPKRPLMTHYITNLLLEVNI